MPKEAQKLGAQKLKETIVRVERRGFYREH